MSLTLPRNYNLPQSCCGARPTYYHVSIYCSITFFPHDQPVVEDLRAQNMSSNTPHRFVPLRCQPLMSQVLRVKVMDLKASMVHMCRLVRAHEECVMVNVVLTAVNVAEYRNLLLVLWQWTTSAARHLGGLCVRIVDVQNICGY